MTALLRLGAPTLVARTVPLVRLIAINLLRG
jgi:hypothetical protein